MSKNWRSLLFRYGLAVVCTLVATSLRLLAQPTLADRVPFVTYFPAVFVTALYAGFGPTLLAVALSGLVAAHFFLPPADSLLPGDVASWTGLALFSLAGIGVALLSEGIRRKSEQVQRERERFAVTLASIGDAVIVTDEHGQITYLNNLAEQLTGWNRSDARGKPLPTVFRIISEQSRQPTVDPVARALREGRIVGLANHTILIARDGSEWSIDDSAAPIREADGRVVGVVLVFRDVSRQRALQLEQGHLSALVDSSEDAILAQSFEAVVTSWNRGAELVFGFTADEVLGKPIDQSIVPPDRKAELLDVLRRIEQGERVGGFETIRRRKDGRRIPVAVRISPIRNAQGQVIGASAIDRDITQQRNAERRRNARLAVTQILAHDKSVESAIREILAAVCTALEWDAGCFWRHETGEDVVRCQEFWQQPDRALEEFRTATLTAQFERGHSLPGRVWERRRPIWIADVLADPQFARAPQAERVGLHSGFSCPVSIDDEFLGAIEFFSHEIQEPDEDLLEMMGTIGGQIGQFMERREGEYRLRRSEQELSDFFENATIGLHWVGADGIILRANQAELHMLGYAPQDYVGHHIAEFHADQEVIDDILQRLSAGEQLHNHEARMRRRDGSIVPVLIDSSVLWEKGQFVHTRCFTRDITQRKRMEQSLRFLAEASKSLSSLVDQKSTLQKVAHLAVPAIADWCAVDMLASDGSLQRLAVAHVDPAKVQLAEDLLRRYPPDADAPRGVRQVLRTGESDWSNDINDALLQAAARDDEHLQILRGLNMTAYMCVPLSAKGTVLGAMSFVSAESGRHYGADDLAMAEDLAHRAAVAIENSRLYEELREADRRKDEFLAMLAHELRNPLAPLRSGLDILAMEENDNHRETVELMQQQVEHVVRLVDDLLDVSRIMRGKVGLRKEHVELAPLLRRAIQAVRPLIDVHQQELNFSLPEQPIWVHADPVRLVQVFENLLNNGAKYTDPGGRVELTLEQQDRQALVSITDTGIGIEPELLPKVFELFTQSSRSLDRAQGGLGIGLTLVQRLVEMHGGTVVARSAGPGLGSTFVVRLPVVEAAPPAEKVDQHPRRVQPRRILIVDDNVGAARMLSLLLTKLDDHQVETVYDGPSALETIGDLHPEIVLLDIGLPGMDGYQVGREIRKIPEFQDVLLVALTGYGQEEDRRKSTAAGFDEHLVKPPSVEQIQEMLSHPKLAQVEMNEPDSRTAPRLL